jgi:hypothetical protein
MKMKDQRKHYFPVDTHSPGSSQSRPPGRFPFRPLSIFTSCIILLAFASCLLLLVEDSVLLRFISHAPVSALPLLLIGLASLCFQIITRPALLDFFKAMIVSAAFLLWGIDQLLPASWLATTLGDIVIILYVVDLGWMMRDRLKHHLPQTLPTSIPSSNSEMQEIECN